MKPEENRKTVDDLQQVAIKYAIAALQHGYRESETDVLKAIIQMLFRG